MGDYGHGDLTQFQKDRFGMFIHWGLYSMPARHEWIRNMEHISNEDYEKYFERFNPDMFHPEEWAKAAREAGMKYFVITTKHHEGFCMWDTKYTDYKITNTPYGKDILRQIVDAFRAEGIKVGFYYSLIDWHHPEFPIDEIHPLATKYNWENRAEINANRDMTKYAQYMRDQVTELLTNYGKIDILWFDFSYPMPQKCAELKEKYGLPSNWVGKGHNDWESEKLIKLVRSLQPNIIVDNRLDLEGSGDIMTPEQFTPDKPVTDANGNKVAWEGCQTFSGSWGYFRDEMSWKSTKQCIDMLVNHVSRDGNLLMNVGPTSRGYIDHRAMACLKGYADWMKYNSRAIYGCGAAPEGLFTSTPPDCRFTYNKETNRLYLHIMDWPFKHITLNGMAGKVAYAQLLHDGSEIRMRENGVNTNTALNETPVAGDLILDLPVIKPWVEVPVVELFLK